MSGASERANERASGPVLQSVFLAVFDHSDVDVDAVVVVVAVTMVYDVAVLVVGVCADCFCLFWLS